MAELEITDPIIKLFGKTIAALPLNHEDKDSGCRFVLHQKVTLCEELVSEKPGNELAKQITDQTTSEISENPSIEKQISSPKDAKNEEQSETSMSQKKPDKILPCPRCNSMDTKFCYYNNYNVNQPRHFCKNCQRYWTSGGTMRNVPVGAGRRKNKSSSSSHFRQLIIPDRGIHHHQFLTFGPNEDENSTKCSITSSHSSEKRGKITSQKSVMENALPFPPQLQPFHGFPWPFFPAAGIPVYYPVPPPYWGCTAPPSWTLTNPNGQDLSTNSSVLGKRLRDGENIKQSNGEVQKTLKMDDPNESAKSSILSKLGIKKGKASASSINGGGLFEYFQQTNSKGKDQENGTENCSLLQANPAALSRALKFREIA